MQLKMRVTLILELYWYSKCDSLYQDFRGEKICLWINKFYYKKRISLRLSCNSWGENSKKIMVYTCEILWWNFRTQYWYHLWSFWNQYHKIRKWSKVGIICGNNFKVLPLIFEVKIKKSRRFPKRCNTFLYPV